MIEYISGEGDSSFSLAGVVSGPGRLVYVAGQVGVGPDGSLVSGGVAAEADATFDLIEQIMQRAGGQLSDVVRMGVYLTSLDRYADFAEVRKRRFPNGLPASSAVQVAGLLLGASIEIDAVGFVAD
jgi:enamine deaminase RidA (YjgF/YER057c/UK114 family)